MPTDMEKARERIADLEYCIEQHLEDTGECGGEGGQDELWLCASADCTYCEMARTLQPTECGVPLSPRPSTCGCGHPVSDHYLDATCAQEPCRKCDCDTYGETD